MPFWEEKWETEMSEKCNLQELKTITMRRKSVKKSVTYFGSKLVNC